MAIKTWASGEVLTASDLNTYAGNPGLVYITQQTVGSGVSSVSVSSAFSATYDNYRVIYTGGIGSTSGTLRFAFNTVTTGYFGALFATNFSTAAFIGGGDNNTAQFNNCGYMSTNHTVLIADVVGPFASGQRKYLSAYACFNSNGYGMFTGECTSTSSLTGFTISPSSGTMTGGIIRVYGYRQA